MATSSDPLVSGLIADAKLVAAYGRYGVFKDNSLFAAIGEVDKLDNATAGQDAVINLQKTLNDCSNVVPFSTLSALRSGWIPGDDSIASRITTAAMVTISVILMIITGQLTYLYNRGVSINSQLQEINADDFSVKFSKSIRQVWEQRQLQLSSSNLSVAEAALLKESYYNSEENLRSMDRKFYDLWSNSQSFIISESPFPIPGMKMFYCNVSYLAMYFSYNNSEFSKAQIAGTCNQIYSDKEQKSTFSCDKIKDDILSKDAFDIDQDYKNATVNLICGNVISIPPDSIPVMTAQIGGVGPVIAPYVLWKLPALYGALGAIMFHMRMILNPLLPNPRIGRLIHRVALGALSGVVLAWFLGPDTKLGGEVSVIGFSLFTFAFLFGFSLDVFFTILDQFVSVSVAGIKKFSPVGGAS